jgi:general stress protein CsbA
MDSYHTILVLFLTVLTSGVFYLTASNLSLPPCVSALLLVRVYALYFRNRWILFILTVEFIAGFVLACVSAAVNDRKYLRVDFVSGLLINCCLQSQHIQRGGQSLLPFWHPIS